MFNLYCYNSLNYMINFFNPTFIKNLKKKIRIVLSLFGLDYPKGKWKFN